MRDLARDADELMGEEPAADEGILAGEVATEDSEQGDISMLPPDESSGLA